MFAARSSNARRFRALSANSARVVPVGCEVALDMDPHGALRLSTIVHHIPQYETRITMPQAGRTKVLWLDVYIFRLFTLHAPAL